MSASLLLRAARQAHGTSQRELAEAASVSQPGIAAIESGAHDTTVSRLEHLLAALGQPLHVVMRIGRGVKLSRRRMIWHARRLSFVWRCLSFGRCRSAISDMTPCWQP